MNKKHPNLGLPGPPVIPEWVVAAPGGYGQGTALALP